ncbi:MFS transporter [Arthrobacter burdickii]|uniref:MFS transporter n=1 Tax=Arthrobacter burdickii TaxID=3035920 RepID=A0ABT8K386_9MICC|nr:MFS transporter [Arthrobacter burdickii]MDN4611906.1 MFS transporter [Arthrobacter burdickii]
MNSASTGNPDTRAPALMKRRRGALGRYVFAATLVRSADGGAVVAIVLLAHASGLPNWLAGLLGASITAPHLLGPFIARRLDTARDGRRVIAFSAVLHGLLLAGAALLIPVTWALWPAVLLFVSGVFGPMLTGGISSRLPSIAGPGKRDQRRAQSWDVASYGISGTLGPAAVAWIAATSDALTASLVLAGAAVLGAGAVLVLPRQAPPDHAVAVPSPRQTLRSMSRHGPLRRTLGLTVTVAFSVAALPIYAVAIAPGLGGAATAGLLVAAYGVGNLLGSAGLMVRPLRGDADRLMSSLAVLVAAALILVILAPFLEASLVAFCLAGVANALFFAATLAARSEYAPIESRGQIFIWVGALKIAAGSAGTAVAGATTSPAAWVPLVLAVTLTALATTVSIIDRRRLPFRRGQG